MFLRARDGQRFSWIATVRLVRLPAASVAVTLTLARTFLADFGLASARLTPASVFFGIFSFSVALRPAAALPRAPPRPRRLAALAPGTFTDPLATRSHASAPHPAATVRTPFFTDCVLAAVAASVTPASPG